LSASALAWCNRAASLALASGAVAAARAIAPDPEQRATLLYALVVALGYGHLIGAAWFSGGASSRRGVGDGLWRVAVLMAVFAVYVTLLRSVPLLVLPLLVISTWHTVENDAVLEATCARRSGVAPLPWAPAHHGVALGGTALLVALFASAGAGPALAPATAAHGLAHATPAPWRGLASASGLVIAVLLPRHRVGAALLAVAAALLPVLPAGALDFAEAFALFGLYHLLSWLWILAERGQLRRLLGVHAASVAPCVVLLALPGETLEAVRSIAFSPAVYLFWSVLHVGQTLRLRLGSGLGAQARAPGSA
jgi:hypothetical protein